jgi:hypothetical protein
MEIPENIWFLFARKLAGEISAAELQELRVFVRDNPAVEPQLESINVFWKQSQIQGKEKVENVYACIMQKISVKDRLCSSSR